MESIIFQRFVDLGDGNEYLMLPRCNYYITVQGARSSKNSTILEYEDLMMQLYNIERKTLLTFSRCDTNVSC